jgi:hypothetical protein
MNKSYKESTLDAVLDETISFGDPAEMERYELAIKYIEHYRKVNINIALELAFWVAGLPENTYKAVVASLRGIK